MLGQRILSIKNELGRRILTLLVQERGSHVVEYLALGGAIAAIIGGIAFTDVAGAITQAFVKFFNPS